MKSNNIQKDANKPQNNQNYIQKNIPLRNEPKPTLQNAQHHLGRPESNTLNKPKENQNNIQNIKMNQIQKYNKLEERKTDNLKMKQNNILRDNNFNNNIQFRNSDGHRLNLNQYNQYIKSQNTNNNKNIQRLPSKGLYGEIKKMNSIVKNGKLICNIDINLEFQITEEYKTFPTFNKNLENYKRQNTVECIKNRTNYNKIISGEQTNNHLTRNIYKSPQIKYNKIIQNKNQNINIAQTPHIKGQNIPIIQRANNKIVQNKNPLINKNYIHENSIQNKVVNQQTIKPTNELNQKQSQPIVNTNTIKNMSQIMPNKTVQSVYPIKDTNQLNKSENKSIMSQIIPNETIKSVYATNQNKNPYSQIIPNETIKSVYPIKESNNQNHIMSQIIPNETIKSVYNTNTNQNQNKNEYPEIIPNETIKSVYKDDKKESQHLLSQLAKSTSKSIYSDKKKN